VPSASATPAFGVSWGASTTPGATYELQEAIDPEFTAEVRTAYTGALFLAQITGRENGATYYYRVRALRDGWNPSVWVGGGNGCEVSWDVTAPGPATDFTAAVVGDRIDLAWTNPGDGDFTGVRVLRRTDRAPAAPDDGTPVYEGPGQSFSDADLSPGTYFYAVFTHDAAPNFSSAVLATALVEPPVAEAPASILVPTSKVGSIYQVTWGVPPTAAASYELEEATSPDFTADLRQAYAGDSLSAPLTGRPSGLTYYYRVRAVRSGWQPSPWREGGNGCAVSWDEVGPAPVSGLLAFSHASHAHLSWVNPADDDFAGVRVVRRPDAVPANPYDGTSVYVGGGQAATDAELVPGTQHYAVFAYDAYPNFSLAATATVQVSEPALCETCHNGDGDGDGNWDGRGYDPDGWAGPDPAAPNVMGDGVVPGSGRPGRPYADGTWGFNVNGHGRAATPARDAECTDCHDISIPAGTHLDGVLNSVELSQNRNVNTAHLRAEFLGRPAPEWDVQVTFDNACLAARPELGGCHDTEEPRHRHSVDADPAAGAVQFGQKGSIANGESIPYPVDSDLSTNAATTSPDFAPCISCHNPHGTNTVDGSYPDNRMLRDERTDTLCKTCHR
jgi:hypothetical protein